MLLEPLLVEGASAAVRHGTAGRPPLLPPPRRAAGRQGAAGAPDGAVTACRVAWGWPPGLRCRWGAAGAPQLLVQAPVACMVPAERCKPPIGTAGGVGARVLALETAVLCSVGARGCKDRGACARPARCDLERSSRRLLACSRAPEQSGKARVLERAFRAFCSLRRAWQPCRQHVHALHWPQCSAAAHRSRRLPSCAPAASLSSPRAQPATMGGGELRVEGAGMPATRRSCRRCTRLPPALCHSSAHALHVACHAGNAQKTAMARAKKQEKMKGLAGAWARQRALPRLRSGGCHPQGRPTRCLLLRRVAHPLPAAAAISPIVPRRVPQAARASWRTTPRQ